MTRDSETIICYCAKMTCDSAIMSRDNEIMIRYSARI